MLLPIAAWALLVEPAVAPPLAPPAAPASDADDAHAALASAREALAAAVTTAHALGEMCVSRELARVVRIFDGLTDGEVGADPAAAWRTTEAASAAMTDVVACYDPAAQIGRGVQLEVDADLLTTLPYFDDPGFFFDPSSTLCPRERFLLREVDPTDPGWWLTGRHPASTWP